MGLIGKIILIALLAVNVFTMLLYGVDKAKAKKNGIRKDTVLFWCARRDGVLASFVSCASPFSARLTHSAARPFPTRSASLGSRGSPNPLPIPDNEPDCSI